MVEKDKTGLIVSEQSLERSKGMGIVPSLSDPKMVRSRVLSMLKNTLVEGITHDYAIIPGTAGKSLLKPGAEKLLLGFSLYPHLTESKDILPKEGMNFTEFVYSCRIEGVLLNADGDKISNIVVCRYEGSANSMERCFTKELTKVGVYGMRPNVRARAMKRALVGATRVALTASDIFSQSGEDLQQAEDNILNPFDDERTALLKSVQAIAKDYDQEDWRALVTRALGKDRLDEILAMKESPWYKISTRELKLIQLSYLKKQENKVIDVEAEADKLVQEIDGATENPGDSDDPPPCSACGKELGDSKATDSDGAAICMACQHASLESEGQQIAF